MHFTKKIEKELILEIFLFSAGVAIISFFYTNNPLILVLLTIALLIAIKFWHKKQDLYFFAVGAVIGSLTEIVCIYFGAWQYTNPSFFGIPAWLPFAWGLGSVLIKRVAETFIKIEKR
jgi:hypothetical protein